jgi:hypothetical protein
MKKSAALALFLVVVALLGWGLAACGDVPMKKFLPDDVVKVSIPPFENKTGQPMLENDLTKKVIQDFIVDGRLHVVPHAEADAELAGTIQRYDRLVLTRSSDSSQVPQQYKLQIAVDIDFTDLRTGKELWTTRSQVNLTPGMEPDHDQFDSTNVGSLKEFTNYYVINVVGVPPEDEPTAQDRLLEQMASRVVRRTLDGF